MLVRLDVKVAGGARLGRLLNQLIGLCISGLDLRAGVVASIRHGIIRLNGVRVTLILQFCLLSWRRLIWVIRNQQMWCLFIVI